MPTPLTDTQRTDLASTLPRWEIDGPSITRTFAFADFSEAMGFVTRVALAAERADHHPDIDVRWNRVRIELSTHSAEALTDLDRDLAVEIDGFAG